MPLATPWVEPWQPSARSSSRSGRCLSCRGVRDRRDLHREPSPPPHRPPRSNALICRSPRRRTAFGTDSAVAEAAAFEAAVSGALEGEPALVALAEDAVVVARHPQLVSFPRRGLEGHEVGGDGPAFVRASRDVRSL